MRFVADGHQQVAITLHARAHPHWNPDAITATVDVRARHVEGRLTTTIWADDLRHLHRTFHELYHQVRHANRAEWGLRAGALSLTLDRTLLGHVRVLVDLRDVDAAHDARLAFSFDAAQTSLPLWMDQIAETMQQFFQEP